MSKCLTVVAFALLVLSGAMGLRNVAASTVSSSNLSAHSVWISGIGPFPNPTGGGGGR